MTTSAGSPIEAATWHPMLRRLHHWWSTSRSRLGRLPGRSDFDPSTMSTLLPLVWMLQVARPAMRLRFRLVGTAICYVLQRDPTGEWLDESPSRGEHWAEAASRYHAVVLTGEPSWREGMPRFEHDSRFDRVETLSVPLAADGRQVDLLLNASIFVRHDGKPLLGRPRSLT